MRPIEDIIKTRAEFERYMGPIDSPRQYNEYCLYTGRMHGKTHALVSALPATGRCIVVGNSYAWNQEIKRMIQRDRPYYPVENIHFLVYNPRGRQTFDEFIHDNYHIKFRGMRVTKSPPPVFFDNAVQDMILESVLAKYTSLLDMGLQYGPGR